MQPTREGFSEHETEYVLHICQYGLREGGRLSILSQQAFHYKPIPDDCFLAVFFLPCPLEHNWKSNTEAFFWRKLVRVVQKMGSELSVYG